MKKLKKIGVCLFAVTLSLILFATIPAAAQSGKGGSTQVIAHVEQPSAGSSDEPQPEKNSSEIQSDRPAKTGDTALPLIVGALSMFCSAAIIFIASDTKSES